MLRAFHLTIAPHALSVRTASVTHDGEPAQRTFIALKHDALQRGLSVNPRALRGRGLKPVAPLARWQRRITPSTAQNRS